MAPVKGTSLSIVRFSSQDPIHRAENVLTKDKKWLSNKTDRSGRIEVEIHLSKAIRIGFINIGNAGSAFIELTVGSSMWSSGTEYVSFLPSTTLMSPQDSKTGLNRECVKMLEKDAFSKSAANQEWDRVRVVCRQPFRKEQFGLQFIDFVPDEKSSHKEGENERQLKTSPKQTLEQFKKMLSPSSSGSINWSPSSGLVSLSPTSSRSAGIVQAALKGKEKPRKILKDVNSDVHKQRRAVSLPKRTATSPYTVDANIKRQKTASRSSAEDIEDEVECFLEAFDFSQLPLEKLTYGKLKNKMEEQRGCPLNMMEKKVFIKLAEKTVSKVLVERDKKDKEKRVQEDFNEADSPSPTSLDSSFPETPDMMVECPICERFFPGDVVELHASTCFGTGNEVDSDTFAEKTADTVDADDCMPRTSSVRQEIEVKSPVKKPGGPGIELGDPNAVACPICCGIFPATQINFHANVCADMKHSAPITTSLS